MVCIGLLNTKSKTVHLFKNNISPFRIVRRLVIFLRFTFFSALIIQGQESLSTQEFQRKMVRELTGGVPIQGTLDVLRERSTPEQRRITANYLCRTLHSIGLAANRHDYKMSNSFFLLDFFFAPMQGTNVYSIIPSTEPSEEYVVIGAHYDSEPGSPGAGDNASGVALVMELGRRLTQMDSRKYKYVIAFFDQEEDDEVGSRAFAKKLMQCGINVHSVHIVDVIAWDDNDDGMIELQSPSKKLEQLYLNAGNQLKVLLKVVGGASSDNLSFLESGFETVGVFSDDLTPHIHKPTDTYDTVDFDFLERSTDLIAHVLKSMNVNGSN